MRIESMPELIFILPKLNVTSQGETLEEERKYQRTCRTVN
jgi:hypothetical protein